MTTVDIVTLYGQLNPLYRNFLPYLKSELVELRSIRPPGRPRISYPEASVWARWALANEIPQVFVDRWDELHDYAQSHGLCPVASPIPWQTGDKLPKFLRDKVRQSTKRQW